MLLGSQQSAHLSTGGMKVTYESCGCIGIPAKNKTRMAIASVEEMSRRLWTSVAEKGILTYFFYQGGVSGLNDAISVVRGLIRRIG